MHHGPALRQQHSERKKEVKQSGMKARGDSNGCSVGSLPEGVRRMSSSGGGGCASLHRA